MNKPNFEYWRRQKLWTLIDAASLISGAKPVRTDQPKKQENSITNDEVRERFGAVYGQLKDATTLKEIKFFASRTGSIGNRRVNPASVISWAQSESFEIPKPLRDLASGQSTSEKPLSTRERHTLLIIIALLAKEVGIDWTKPSKAAEMVLSLADKLGVTMGQRTIEEHLKKIPEAMRSRGK